MSVSIRLAKIGRIHTPAYRIVVANTRDKRNGRSLDILGHYNPIDKKNMFVIDNEKYAEWIKKGAIVTDAVKSLVAGTYVFKKYDPKAAKEAAEASAQA